MMEYMTMLEEPGLVGGLEELVDDPEPSVVKRTIRVFTNVYRHSLALLASGDLDPKKYEACYAEIEHVSDKLILMIKTAENEGIVVHLVRYLEAALVSHIVSDLSQHPKIEKMTEPMLQKGITALLELVNAPYVGGTAFCVAIRALITVACYQPEMRTKVTDISEALINSPPPNLFDHNVRSFYKTLQRNLFRLLRRAEESEEKERLIDLMVRVGVPRKMLVQWAPKVSAKRPALSIADALIIGIKQPPLKKLRMTCEEDIIRFSPPGGYRGASPPSTGRPTPPPTPIISALAAPPHQQLHALFPAPTQPLNTKLFIDKTLYNPKAILDRILQSDGYYNKFTSKLTNHDSSIITKFSTIKSTLSDVARKSSELKYGPKSPIETVSGRHSPADKISGWESPPDSVCGHNSPAGSDSGRTSTDSSGTELPSNLRPPSSCTSEEENQDCITPVDMDIDRKSPEPMNIVNFPFKNLLNPNSFIDSDTSRNFPSRCSSKEKSIYDKLSPEVVNEMVLQSLCNIPDIKPNYIPKIYIENLEVMKEKISILLSDYIPNEVFYKNGTKVTSGEAITLVSDEKRAVPPQDIDLRKAVPSDIKTDVLASFPSNCKDVDMRNFVKSRDPRVNRSHPLACSSDMDLRPVTRDPRIFNNDPRLPNIADPRLTAMNNDIHPNVQNNDPRLNKMPSVDPRVTHIHHHPSSINTSIPPSIFFHPPPNIVSATVTSALSTNISRSDVLSVHNHKTPNAPTAANERTTSNNVNISYSRDPRRRPSNSPPVAIANTLVSSNKVNTLQLRDTRQGSTPAITTSNHFNVSAIHNPCGKNNEFSLPLFPHGPNMWNQPPPNLMSLPPSQLLNKVYMPNQYRY